MRTLNRQQVRDVDRRAIEEYGLSGLVLMENAGRGVVDILCREEISGEVVICCGRGNNAGDGFVIARHLDLRGHKVRVFLWSDPAMLTGDAAANYAIIARARLPIEIISPDDDPTAKLSSALSGAGWGVDALLGTGATGEPRPPIDRVIDVLNASRVPILAVDLPSGLDCDTGQPARHTIQARITCTFVAAKPGFFTVSAEQYTGRVEVLDIGAPRRLIDEMFVRATADD
ncbi:MAG: NAD(P)H-hydrate epimerase [Pirellulales bacterium]|nr:NAD(P)H-hydrate epimerase [Pirellulales bacterium]